MLVSFLIIGFVFIFAANAIFRNLIAGKGDVFISNNKITGADLGPQWFKHGGIILNVQNGPLFLMAIRLQHVFNFNIYTYNATASIPLNTISDRNINILLFMGELFIEILTPIAVLIFFINFFFDVRFIYRHRFSISESRSQIYHSNSSRFKDARFLEVNEGELLHELRIKRALNLDIGKKNTTENAEAEDAED